jgi:ammonium transporter Rh
VSGAFASRELQHSASGAFSFEMDPSVPETEAPPKGRRASAGAASAPEPRPATTPLPPPPPPPPPASGASTAAPAAPAAAHGKSLFVPNRFAAYAGLLQAALIAIFATTTSFNPLVDEDGGALGVRYAMYQDVHVMMLVGFGFLYTLLRRYAWSGVSINFFITVLVIQISLLTNGFFALLHANPSQPGAARGGVPLSVGALINADFSAATVLISFGALLGRVSPTQMLVMAAIETVCASANTAIGVALGVADAGGSIYIHTFGAAFGLAVAWGIGDRATRHNATFAMVGTLFLFCFWPSFNAAVLPPGADHQRAVVNTVLSICASAVISFALSKAIHGGASFDREHVQNATLAGGVVMGAACNLFSNAGGALAAGAVAGAVSTYGFSFFSPLLKRAGLTDTCGILNLHLLPGLLGGIASAIAAPGSEAAAAAVASGASASLSAFAGRQAAMTLIALVLGLASGFATGRLLLLDFAEPMNDGFYEDASHWNVPFEEEENPEADSDVATELERRLAAQRAELGRSIATLVARLREAGVAVSLEGLALGGGEASPRGGGAAAVTVSVSSPQHGASDARSANERFLEGSVRGGRAYAASRGELSVHAGTRYTAAAGVGEEGTSPAAKKG